MKSLRRASDFVSNYKIFFIAIVAFALLSLFQPMLVSKENLYAILVQMSGLGIAAIGMTICFIGNRLDISTGSIISLCAAVFALTIERFGLGGAIVFSFLTGMACGAITGFLVAICKVDSFIISLSMMTALRALSVWIAGSRAIMIHNPIMSSMGSTLIFGFIPMSFVIFLVFAILVDLLLRNTLFGRNIYALGGNREAAKSVGINVTKYDFLLFVINGFCAALAAFALILRMQSSSPVLGDDAPLSIIPMIIIGGNSMTGGKGSALRTLMGAFFMSLLFNVMTVNNIYVNAQDLIKGAILITVVALDTYSVTKKQKI